MSEAIHETDRYANIPVEELHEATRVRERGIPKVESMRQAQRFVSAHAAVQNWFNLGRLSIRVHMPEPARQSRRMLDNVAFCLNHNSSPHVSYMDLYGDDTDETGHS